MNPMFLSFTSPHSYKAQYTLAVLPDSLKELIPKAGLGWDEVFNIASSISGPFPHAMEDDQ
jgi:hypothetical protein